MSTQLMEEIIVSYEGPSFVDHQISIRQLRTALGGLDLFVKTIDPTVSIYIEPFSEGSFKFKFLTKKELSDAKVQIITGLFFVFINFYTFTGGDNYTVDLANSQVMGDVNIVNINGDIHSFSKEILPLVKNSELKKATQKIISPLSGVDDKMIFSDNENNLVCKIDYLEKESFLKNQMQEHDQFIVRGRIYEINFKQKSFKVESSFGYSFNVSLSDDLKIESVYPWVNTNSLELIGQVKMDIDGKILSMVLYDFRVIAPRLVEE